MFNDKCELTKAVLDGNKTMTRRDAKLFNKNTVVHGKKNPWVFIYEFDLID